MRHWFEGLRLGYRRALVVSVAIAAGYLATLAHLPLGWLLGALVSAGVMAFLGFGVPLPKSARQAGQTVAGFAAGLYFTPEVAALVSRLGGWIALACTVSLAVSLFAGWLLARYGGCDRTTAFFSTLPGGLAEMSVLAQRFGAHPAPVSLAQTLRVVMVVMILPTLTAAVAHVAPGVSIPAPPIGLHALAIGVCASAALALAFRAIHLFNPWLLGGLVAGMVTALVVGEATRAPAPLVALAQIAIGTTLGMRFERQLLSSVGQVRFLPVLLLTTLFSIAAHVAIAWGVSGVVPFPVALLATAPAGIAEMSLTAQLLVLAPPLVVAWQLCRILAVALLTGPLFKIFLRLR